MDVQELHEMQEHAEEGGHDRTLLPVTFTMAVLAVVLAATTLLGHRAHTEELLLQNKVTDQWAYYQAKSIRQHSYELFLDLLSVAAVRDAAQAESVKTKYTQQLGRYTDELADLQKEAHSLEGEIGHAQRQANRFDLGEVFLEAAIVIASLTLLTKQRLFWLLGIVLGVGGLAVALTGFVVH